MILAQSPFTSLPDSLEVAYLGIAYSQEIQVTGGVAPYNIENKSVLINGLVFSFNQNNSPDTFKISGTPINAVSGAFPVIIKATDSNGQVGYLTL